MKLKNLKSFLIPILFCVSLTGCGSDSSKQIVFDAEKSFQEAEKMYGKAAIKPDLTDQITWGNIKDAYILTLSWCWTNIDSLPKEKYPVERRDLESVAFMATSRLSSIYFAESKFDSSVFILEKLLSLTELKDKPLLSSMANLARAYHAKGDWTGGMDIYKSILSRFDPPVDSDNNVLSEVLNLPIELLNIGIKIGDIPNTFEGSKNTRDYYTRLISEWPNTELEKDSRRILAKLLVGYKKWDDAIATLEPISDSTGSPGLMESIRISEIYGFGKNDHNRSIQILESLLNRTNDTTTIFSIYKKIAVAQFENKAYGKCRETIEKIKDDYYRLYMADPIPQKYLALSYDKQGDWGRAEDEYQWLITNFPNTEEAFEAYLTIADHYNKAGNKELKNTWYRKADDFYAKMQRENAGTVLEASAISYRAEVARRLEQWDIAARRLEELYRRFPNEESGQRGLANAIVLYRDKLKNQAKADSLKLLLKPGT